MLEKYVSPWVIPGEKILGYIKWRPDLEVKEIRIDLPEHTLVPRVLDVDSSVFKDITPKFKSFSINRNQLQVEGFVGFEAHYSTVPDKEIRITFDITAVLEDLSEMKVALTTEVIRPLLSPVTSSAEIFSTIESPEPRALEIALVNKGRGDVLEDSLKPYIQIIKGRDLKIQIQSQEEKFKVGERLFVKKNTYMSSKILVSGKGYGAIRLGFKYLDRLGNNYVTEFLDVIITVAEKRTLEVPLENTVLYAGKMAPILEPAVLAR